MADRRRDSRTAPKTEGGLNHGQNGARARNAPVPGRPQALEAKEAGRSASRHANGQENVMNDERENIAHDLVRLGFRVARYLGQRP